MCAGRVPHTGRQTEFARDRVRLCAFDLRRYICEKHRGRAVPATSAQSRSRISAGATGALHTGSSWGCRVAAA